MYDESVGWEILLKSFMKILLSIIDCDFKRKKKRFRRKFVDNNDDDEKKREKFHYFFFGCLVGKNFSFLLRTRMKFN